MFANIALLGGEPSKRMNDFLRRLNYVSRKWFVLEGIGCYTVGQLLVSSCSSAHTYNNPQRWYVHPSILRVIMQHGSLEQPAPRTRS